MVAGASACVFYAVTLLRLFLLCWCVLCCCFVSSGSAAQAGSTPLLPSALAYDAAGNLYIADANRHQVLEATLAGRLVVVAGTGTQGFAGDGGAAGGAELNSPQGLAFSPDGTLYIADTGNARIRAVSGTLITTFAGNGMQGFAGDGGAAIKASLRAPTALAFDRSGALLVCDSADHRVRRIAGSVISTFAGNGLQGFAGDGGPAKLAELDSPFGIAVAPDGRVFVSDTHNHRIRSVATDGTITTFAGTGQRGFAGDGGLAPNAQFAAPRGLTFAPGSVLLVADSDNQRVRSIDDRGIISSVAGTLTEGTSVDGATALSAALHSPRAVALSSFGMPAIADIGNGTIRVLTPGQTLYQPAALAPGRASALQPSMPPALAYGTGVAMLTVAGPAGLPQGIVSLGEGGATLTSAVLNSGTAKLDLGSLNAGIHALTISYAGDGLNPGASLSTASLTVTPAPLTASAGTASIPYGAGLPTLTGSLAGVLPQDAGQVTATFAVDPNQLNGVGTYPITVSLSGPKSGNYAVNLAPGSGVLDVTQAGSKTWLSQVPQSYAGMPLRLSANVLPNTAGQPTGSVQFVDGSTVIATAALVHGSASAVYAAPPAGSLSLTARYLGSTNFGPSASLPQVAQVDAMPDFNLSPNGTTTATVPAGITATYSVLVSAQPSPFTGVVALSASGLPAGATVSFSPVQVVPGTGSATVTVSVVTPAPQAALRPHTVRDSLVHVSLAGMFACFGIFVRRRRRMASLLSLTLLLCGCGARTVSELGSGLPSQTYRLQIMGTSTNLLGDVVTHSAVVTLTVHN